MLSDPLSIGIAVATGGLALLTGWRFLPGVPALDGERWFKVALATVLRGAVEAGGGDVDAWRRAVRRWVWYHPAGRNPELKVENPVAALLPSAALPGEGVLLEDLARLTDRSARYRRMYDEDPTADDARFADPSALGEAFDPATWLSLPPTPGRTAWDLLASWGAGDPAFQRALLERLHAHHFVVAGRPRPPVPSLVSAIEAEAGATRIDWAGATTSTAAAIREALRKLGPDEVAILYGEEAGCAAILRALVDEPELRDRVYGVVSIGGIIGGDPGETGDLSEGACEDWLGANFGHLRLDTERVRWTPYFSLQWLDRAEDPPGAAGLPVQRARFPPPRHDRGVIPVLEAVDLGVLPLDPEIPTALVARALVAVVGCWILSRR